ncbi:BC1872 family protein [Paenibacillus oryzisoli]|uniref:Phage ABA sandwich domain-containing protein n=1 Tax=Paenibacillus oryzisoli TaxID=1850517 RepID=A0A198ADV8_9BACL|nr:hypothetical protein [Paenibacillus oryzisoli]OAS19270.1 hypothetical protein A8708_26535 [Paenibacillus oryzisoli]
MRGLTREEILAMEPGRELDALVAEKVMNLCVLDSVQQYGDGCVVSDEGFESWMQHMEFGRVDDPDLLEPYSTDISAAWEVVEKMHEKGYAMQLMHNGQYFVAFSGEIYREYIAKTAAEAICRSALAVLEATP